jgi:hypothetical protein
VFVFLKVGDDIDGNASDIMSASQVDLSPSDESSCKAVKKKEK